MLALSKSTGYAVLALASLEDPGGQPRHVPEVAERARIPRTYLSKVTRSLALKGLISTKRGYKGGLILTRPAREITLKEIVEAVEGPRWIGPCLLGIENCLENCPTRSFWQVERARIEAELERITLAEMSGLRFPAPVS